MKIIKYGTLKVIMSNPGSIHNYFTWPSVAKLQNGLCAYLNRISEEAGAPTVIMQQKWRFEE